MDILKEIGRIVRRKIEIDAYSQRSFMETGSKHTRKKTKEFPNTGDLVLQVFQNDIVTLVIDKAVVNQWVII
ncbi:hypothetical protein CEXT_691681 [Caerostris extrusa]|uniref:Uncharacterized protein n=1 Tax=Caerostris extrusa TaxID=172846 RepID=A0AAV4SF72_CAEEX|nr:hypothetical protein CEXT_691681 [Caerostris extrusa]